MVLRRKARQAHADASQKDADAALATSLAAKDELEARVPEIERTLARLRRINLENNFAKRMELAYRGAQ